MNTALLNEMHEIFAKKNIKSKNIYYPENINGVDNYSKHVVNFVIDVKNINITYVYLDNYVYNKMVQEIMKKNKFSQPNELIKHLLNPQYVSHPYLLQCKSALFGIFDKFDNTSMDYNLRNYIIKKGQYQNIIDIKPFCKNIENIFQLYVSSIAYIELDGIKNLFNIHITLSPINTNFSEFEIKI